MDATTTNSGTWTKRSWETWNVYADANLTMTKQLMDFTANTTKEGISLYAELQTANLETLQESQTYFTKCVSDLPKDIKNPTDTFKTNMDQFAMSAEKVNKLLQNNTQAVLRSTEQYWLTVQKTGTSLKDTCMQWQEKLTTLFAPSH